MSKPSEPPLLRWSGLNRHTNEHWPRRSELVGLEMDEIHMRQGHFLVVEAEKSIIRSDWPSAENDHVGWFGRGILDLLLGDDVLTIGP